MLYKFENVQKKFGCVGSCGYAPASIKLHTSFLISLDLVLSLVENSWSSNVAEDFGTSDMVRYFDSSCIVEDLSLSFIYDKVASYNISGLEVIVGFFRLLRKEIFSPCIHCKCLQGLCREIAVQGFQIYGDCMYTRNPCNFEISTL